MTVFTTMTKGFVGYARAASMAAITESTSSW